MEPKELNELLLNRFPMIKSKFEQETNWQDGINTGSIVVFEDVYFKYIKRYIKNEKLSTKNFDFIKELLALDDEYVKDVVVTALIENMISSTKKDLFVKYFDDNMKKIANEIGAKYFYNWKEIA